MSLAPPPTPQAAQAPSSHASVTRSHQHLPVRDADVCNMTPDINRPVPDVEALKTDPEGIPTEWVIWAAAIERREDLRFRVGKKSSRVRVTEAVAQQSGEQ